MVCLAQVSPADKHYPIRRFCDGILMHNNFSAGYCGEVPSSAASLGDYWGTISLCDKDLCNTMSLEDGCSGSGRGANSTASALLLPSPTAPGFHSFFLCSFLIFYILTVFERSFIM